jgi:hypothetical protein
VFHPICILISLLFFSSVSSNLYIDFFTIFFQVFHQICIRISLLFSGLVVLEFTTMISLIWYMVLYYSKVSFSNKNEVMSIMWRVKKYVKTALLMRNMWRVKFFFSFLVYWFLKFKIRQFLVYCFFCILFFLLMKKCL